jgi:thioredoxin 1
MKRSIFILTGILAVSMLNCKGQADRKGESGKNTVETAKAAPLNTAENPKNTAPVHITKAEFLKLVMDYEKNPKVWSFKGEKPCLIDFYADWCAPCRITSPILEDLAKEYAGRINIYKIDIEKEQELAAVFGVQSIPTFLFCPVEGNPTKSSGIANSPEATKSMFIQQIEELLLKKANASSI